ncbi:MAG: hypothetical protein ACP5XB_26475 [Isosphaeraceae bacterium]
MSSPPNETPNLDPDTSSPAEGVQTGVAKGSGPPLAWKLTLALALLAGAAAWWVGEAYLDYFKPSQAASSQRFDFTALNKEKAVANAYNGTLAFGALGGFVGLALGLAGGFSRRPGGSPLLGAIVGLALGVAAGALPSLEIMPWQWRHRSDDPSSTQLLIPLLMHLGLWSGAGLAGGLAFGLGAGAKKPLRLAGTAISGLLGAMLGTLVFEIIGAGFFPLASTTLPFSDTALTRLLARLCVAGFIGAVMILPRLTSPKTGARSS